MVILRVEIGLQVAYFEGASALKALEAAQYAQVPEHRILVGTLFVAGTISPAAWIEAAAKAAANGVPVVRVRAVPLTEAP